MINRIDLMLLKNLRENSRDHLSSISREYGVPVTTLTASFNRINKKLSIRHTTLVDFKRFGYGLRVGFIVRLKNKTKRKALEEFILNERSNNNFLRLSPDHDYYIEGYFRNVKELYLFEEKLCSFGMESFEIIHLIEELACEKFIPTDL